MCFEKTEFAVIILQNSNFSQDNIYVKDKSYKSS